MLPNGAVLQAVWQNGSIVGDVVCTYMDGSVYTGGWANNQKHGKGVVKYANGRTLQGEFREGRINTGQGTYVYPNGSSYTGAWADSSWHGFGTLTHTRYTFVGHFEHGTKHGQGKLTYQDGRSLQGEWKDGAIYEGIFVHLQNTGEVEERTWVAGELSSTASSSTANVPELICAL